MRHTILVTMVILTVWTVASGQTTEFTYQGSLNVGTTPGTPANTPHDFEFRLFATDTGGSALGTLQRLNVAVTNGTFSVKLDFGAQFPGANRYLEISVRPVGSGGGFQQLLPRQSISSTPYSIRSLNAATADSIPVGGLPAGSVNYIQNQLASPQSASFNIGGHGIVGGDLGVGTTTPASKLHVFGNGVLRVNADSDSNAGFGLSLNNQMKWSVATVSPGQFQIFNQALVSNALWIDNATNNVGIGSTSPAATLEVNGYTKLGSDAPSIKVKKLTGTSAATEGAFVQIFHGLDSSKILSVSVMVNSFGSNWGGPSYVFTNGFHFNWSLFGSYIGVYNAAGGSANILSKPVKILIIYEQ